MPEEEKIAPWSYTFEITIEIRNKELRTYYGVPKYSLSPTALVLKLSDTDHVYYPLVNLDSFRIEKKEVVSD